ncbi:MAG: YfhO family protein, partial [Phycisphaerales bacterium]
MVWAAFFLLLAAVYSAVVFLRPENFLVLGWDFRDHQLFLKTFLAESLRDGELPLWIPYICAGRPFVADPQAGVFYPPNLLYALLSVEGATTLLVILHIAAAGYSCFLFCRELALNRYASLLGGVTFMFNGFLVTRAYRGQLDPLMSIALTPLLFFLFERAERRGDWRWYLWAGMAGALQVLAGSPHFAWLTWLGLVVYVLCRRFCQWREGGFRALGKSASGLVVALACAAGLAAVQILPAAELVGQSIRSTGSFEFAGAFAFEHQKIVHMLFPNYLLSPGIQYFNNLPEATGYIGLLGLV